MRSREFNLRFDDKGRNKIIQLVTTKVLTHSCAAIRFGVSRSYIEKILREVRGKKL